MRGRTRQSPNCSARIETIILAALTKFRFPSRAGSRLELRRSDGGWGLSSKRSVSRTMESKLVPGLYLIGEILDCDGRIGGFNFQWAWATGFLAGRAVSASVCTDGEARR